MLQNFISVQAKRSRDSLDISIVYLQYSITYNHINIV